MRTIALFAFFLTIPTAFAGMPQKEIPRENQLGKLTVFRWNSGFKAERMPVVEKEIAEDEFRALVKQAKLPDSPEIYRGCYLAHFEAPKKAGREIASAEPKPKSEIFRICQK